MKIKITGGEVEIDDADAPSVLKHSWYVNEHGYAVSRIGGKLVKMHKFLTGTDHSQHVDHKHGNGLDNRRSEMRLATRNQNMWNSVKKNRGGKRITTSIFKGVSLDKKYGGWVTEVWKFGKKIFTKHFDCEEHAAVAYNIVSLREFGEFSKPNSVSVSEDDFKRITQLVDSYTPRKAPRWGTITFRKKTQRWYLYRTRNGKKKYIGGFLSWEAADSKLTELQQLTGGAPTL